MRDFEDLFKRKALKRVAITPERLEMLEGVLSLGGNAFEDSEDIYD